MKAVWYGMILAMLCELALALTVIYIAWHFISKWW